MKNNYQKIKIVFFSIMLISIIEKSYAQPIGTPNGTITPWNPANSSFAWFRGGNTATLTGGVSNNIFGTFWPSPIYTYTDSQFRQVILGNITSPTTVAATPQNKSGFIGINTQDPWSRLHIVNGIYGACGGYRPWMREGLNIQTNDDQLWFGHRQWGAVNPEQQNAVINWSDDGASGAGPDHLVFNFTSTSASLAAYPAPNVNPNAQTLEGREMMRITDLGNVGIGPRFSNAFIPQSTLHQHQQNDASSWFQISNQFMTATGGNTNTAATGVNQNDGIRLGILGQNTLIQNGNGFLYNQENRHILFSTANQTPASMNTTRERLRITNIGAPTTILSAPFYGVHNPASLPVSRTRVSISYDPANPVTRPLSLLHLGYNTNNDTINNTYDGWRNWMDIGMLVVNRFDHMYFGVKREGAIDRSDAIIGWGNEADTIQPFLTGPDVLRFVFTETLDTSSGAPSANLNDGLETMRIYPGVDTTSISGPSINARRTWGRVGIGDFSVNNINGQPTHKLDVDGNARLRLLPDSLYIADSTVNKYVMVDSTGVLRWSTGINIFGWECSAVDSLPNVGITSDRKIPMKNNNIYYNGQGVAGAENSIYIGDSCGVFFPAKLMVNQDNDTATIASSYAGAFVNQDSTTVPNTKHVGVAGYSVGIQIPGKPFNIGGEFYSQNSRINYGVSITAINNTITPGAAATGAEILVQGTGPFSQGVHSYVTGGTGYNYGIKSETHSLGLAAPSIAGYFEAFGSSTSNVGVASDAQDNNALNNFGIFTRAQNANNNYGVYSIVDPNQPNSYAGYFNGDVFVNGGANSGTGYLVASDETIKTDIDSITDALSIISLIKPKSFHFDTLNTHNLRLSSKKQYGVIAQDIESVLPELVSTTIKPADIDTAGNIINPSFAYKSVNYNAFIAILIKGVQEQNTKMDSLETLTDVQDSINNALQDQINTLYGMITSCCNNSNSQNSIQQNPNQNQNNSLDITLSDNVPSIVLDQNVPNPFAEQTTITYTLTDGVQKAQMLFYNIEGKLIQAVDLSNASGQGQMNVFANDLSTGVYTYTLVVDGAINGTKRMVKN